MSISVRNRIIVLGVTIVTVVVLLSSWAFYNKNQTSNVTKDKPLILGTSPSFANPLNEAVEEAKQQGINVKLVEFTDWNTPNMALNNGDIDANYFQHQPFLTNVIKQNPAYHLSALGKGIATHVGLYSKKYTSLDALPNHARVVVPNDQVNQGRALLLLQQAKLISLKDPSNFLSNLNDISSNPKQLQFVEVEGPQTARAVDDADLVFSYPHYLRMAKTIDPDQALLFDDTTNNRYAILFVTRDDYTQKNPERAEQLGKFIHIYQTSPKVKQILNEEIGKKLWFPGWQS